MHCGDAREVLASMEPDSVHCVVTSPPYWGLRDYGLEPVIWGGREGCLHVWGAEKVRVVGRNDSGASPSSGVGFHGQAEGYGGSRNASQGSTCSLCGAWRGTLGNEPQVEGYLAHLIEVFRAVKRVLRDDGTLWLNMGDSYAAHPGQRKTTDAAGPKQQTNTGSTAASSRHAESLKPKDLIMMPARVALALQADGWWVRSDIIWHKPNPMPESVRDRPTSAHEHVFMLTKSARYYWDQEAVREVGQEHKGRAGTFARNGAVSEHVLPNQAAAEHRSERTDRVPAGRNLRNVWTMATQPYPEAHFATFPERLPETCILAGTSERGVCPSCGAPWARVIEKGDLQEHPDRMNRNVRNVADYDGAGYATRGNTLGLVRDTKTIDWRPTCDCPAAPAIPATVLDPFAGSGTTGLVAARLGRRALLIDASLEYCDLARERIGKGNHV